MVLVLAFAGGLWGLGWAFKAPLEAGRVMMSLLFVVVIADHLVLPCQSTPLKECVGSTDYTEMSVKAGHIGLSVGSRAHKEIWPKATASTNSSNPARARKPGGSSPREATS